MFDHQYDFYCTDKDCQTKAEWTGEWTDEATLKCGNDQCFLEGVVYNLDALLQVLLDSGLGAQAEQWVRERLKERGTLFSPPLRPYCFRVVALT